MLIRTTRLVLAAFIPALILGNAACQPSIPAPQPVVIYPTQTEGTVHLQGDSVSFQTYYQTGIQSEWATSREVVPGQKIDVWGWGDFDPPMVSVPKRIERGEVDTLVWALGLNEIASSEGWSLRYQLLWTNLLQNQLPVQSCLVMVKPWVLPQGYTERPLSRVNAIRSWIDDFAVTHKNVVVVDWKFVLDLHPEYSAKDGVHLDTPEAALARDGMYREGLNRCP